MKKIFLVILVLIFLMGVASFYYNNNPGIIINALDKKDSVKPRNFVYLINLFGVVPVARAEFALRGLEQVRGRAVNHLSLAASPLPIVSVFFKGSALLDSYVDIKTGNPVLFKQVIVSSGKEAGNKEVFYDQEGLVMTIGEDKRQILPNTQDPLSLLFNIFKADFDKAKDLEMNINTNQKNYLLKGAIENKVIKTGKLERKVVLSEASIKRRDKNPYHQTKVGMVLLKENGRNTPILIKIFASGLYVSAKLIEVK